EERDAKTVEVVITESSQNEEGSGGNQEEGGQGEPQKPPLPPERSGPSVPGIVLTSIGVVSAGAGIALFFGPRQSTINELNVKCGGDTSCPPSAKEIADRGRLYTGAAEAAVGVGALAIITGVVLLATSGGSKPAESQRAAPSIRF